MVIFWRGKRIEDLTRSELIEAIQQIGSEYKRLTSDANLRAMSIGRRELLKQGIVM